MCVHLSCRRFFGWAAGLAAMMMMSGNALAQSYTHNAMIDGAHALPANPSPWVSTGRFYVNDGTLFGIVYSPLIGQISDVSLFESATPSEMGIKLDSFRYGGISFGGGGVDDAEVYDIVRPLTPSESLGFNSGSFWVSIQTRDPQLGQFRGEILVIPEPQTFILLVFGFGALWLVRARNMKRA
jgi:hypothetical protein